MNVNDIITQNITVGGKKTAFGTNSFLKIGKKGQVVDGVVSMVSDRVSINFSGTEISVPVSSVQNATEGETRSFKIMEVSKEGIVLKEVGRDVSSGGRPIVGTTVDRSTRSFSDHLNDSGKLSEARKQAGENIAVLTGEDYQDIETEQGALEEYKASAVDRAIERHKENRRWQQENVQNNIERSKEFQESIKTLQEQGVTQLMSPEEIESALRDADLPVTKANVSRIASAVQMAAMLPELSGDAKGYILNNQMVPTIENLYQGQYCGSGTLDASMADDEVWNELQEQIIQMLTDNGMQADEQTMEDARWLFANDIPVTAQNLQILQKLDDISKEMTPQKLLQQIIFAMQTGASPKQASLDDSQIVVAQTAIKDIREISTEAVIWTVRNYGQDEITLQKLKSAEAGQEDDAASQDRQEDTETSQVVIVKRQLEELRLRMTISSALKMEQKGIKIELTPLQELVEELRRQEQDYFRELMPEADLSISQMDRVQETLSKTSDIRRAPAAFLGTVRQYSLLTMNVLHRAAVSATAQAKQYQADYEAVGTRVRTDLGDSIQKAFQNIPEILDEAGMEATEANQRAVRILGYNNIEITGQNIQQIKKLDNQVNDILDHMKPGVVMRMIREGDNPLDMPLDELDEKLLRLSSDQEISDEERYSRYLWRLEQEKDISEQEREGYIGVYRLLDQVEKSDGAVIGRVMDAGWDMTLRNLLTAARTEKRKGMDTKIDDQFGGLTDLRYSAKNISDQIESGFAGNDQDEGAEQSLSQDDSERQQSNNISSQTEDSKRYYESLVRQTIHEMTPAGIHQMSDGDMEKLLENSLERFYEKLRQAEGNKETEQQLYDELAQNLRNTMEQSEESVRYLEQMGLPDTISNIQAAEQMINGNFDIYHEIDKRSRRFSEEKREELHQSMVSLADDLGDSETFGQHLQDLENIMGKLLEQEYEEPSVSSDELRNLGQLRNGMIFQGSRARRYSYDIPVEMDEGVTTMNVTLIRGEDEGGRVQIYMEEVSAEFRVRRNEMKGLILCGDRERYDSLSGNSTELERSLEQEGFLVRNISYSMDHRSRVDAMPAGAGEKTPSAALYRAAKCIVKYVIHNISNESV